MPRKALVTVEEAVQSLKKFISYFATSELPKYTDKVWEEISKDLNDQWNAHNIYNNVVQDRRDILSTARKRMGINIPSPKDKVDTKAGDTISNASTTCGSSDESYVDQKNALEDGQQLFTVQLTSEEWDAIKPMTLPSGRQTTLQKGVWNNIVPIAISRQTKIPCAYVFKRSKVSQGTNCKSNFVTIHGRCKGESCQNKLKVYIEQEPANNDSVILKVVTRDTRNVPHEVVKRPLNGKYREDVQKDLMHEGASNFRKRKAREEMVLGDPEPPYLPDQPVLRRAKKQRIDKNLGLDLLNEKNLNASIEAISEQPEFVGKIEYIASSPFVVVYRTPSQLHAFKEYCKKTANSTVMIDATGSLVRKIDRNNKTRCGPIFLYSMVINFDKLTMPVHQMLSERHDAHSVMTWIHLLMRAGAPKPKIAICDYSKALLYGMCREFNETTLKNYIQKCFEKLITKKPLNFATRLRVDVAHILHAVSKWKCWKAITHIEVKQFFLRSLALMIQASDIKYFKKLLTYTFAVAGQKYLDSIVEIPIKHDKADGEVSGTNSVLEIRNNLETLMAKTGIDMSKFGSDTADSEHLRPVDDLSDYVKSESNGSKIKCIVEWVDEILTTATSTEIEGSEMNAFYVPDFIPLMKALAMEFPLWTNCTTPEMKGNASSAPIESYFNDLKTNVLRKGLRRADNFLVTHLRDIEGGSLLFVANTARHKNEETISEETASEEPAYAETACEEPPYEEKAYEEPAYEEPVFEQVDLHNVSSYCEVDSQTSVIPQHDPDLWSIENWGGQVPKSEFVNGAISENEDNEGQEEGITEVPDVWDHSYGRSEEVPMNPIKEPQNGVPCTGKTANADLTKKSTYFGPLAEIRYINSQIDKKPAASKKKMKPCFLENGSKLPQPVKVNSKTYFAQSTCPFDSVSQILLSGAVDHPTYDSAIKKSSNTTLQFIAQTLTTGVTRKTYTNRARLLLNWYTPQPNVKTENKVLSYTLSAYDSIYNFVDKAMKTEPSVYIMEECSRLCRRQYSSVLMSPNHNTVAKTGFGALEAALNFWPRLTKLRCFNKDCNASMTRISRPGIHLFIDADIRNNLSDKRGMRCKLSDIPASLKLKDGEENYVQYRLIGVVGFTPDHFTGYSFRNTTNWEHYDDMAIKKTLKSAATEIEPHLIIYVRLSET